ncbi:MAG: UDP-N-acetylmuramoyl-L-alanyl-D-glutamate--2,6-diaminopimelate ligase [Pseudomonadota bacterium]
MPLSELLDGVAQGDVPPIDVTGLADDSRQVRPGALFLAAAGLQRHGLEFVEQALAAGAAAVAYEPGSDHPVPNGAVCVPSLSRRRGRIAARFYEHPSRRMRLCGVTGTNGKTTTVHLLARASRLLGLKCAHMGTLGFGLNEPLTPSPLTTPDVLTVHRRLAFLLRQGAQHVAMEVSSHALDQGRVDDVLFDTAVFTNLSRDHLDYHKTVQAYVSAKQKLFAWPNLRHAVMNVDDPIGARTARALPPGVALTAVGTSADAFEAANRWIAPRDVVATGNGLTVTLATSEGEASIQSPLLGRFNAYNLMQAMGVLTSWGASMSDAASALGTVASPSGRMETHGGGTQPLMVIDYAHTPDALVSALGALRDHTAGRLVCVFGCGGDRDRGKRPLMAAAAAAADHAIVTDDNPRHEDPDGIVADIVDGFGPDDSFEVCRDRAQAVGRAAASCGPCDVVLVAGKGHEGVQIVGSTRLPMSDRDLVADALVSLSGVAS